MIVWFCIVCLLLIGSLVLLFLSIKRSLQYDLIFELVAESFDESLHEFNALSKKEVFSNTPEVKQLQRSVANVRDKLTWYSDQVMKLSTRQLLKKEVGSYNRPVVR